MYYSEKTINVSTVDITNYKCYICNENLIKIIAKDYIGNKSHIICCATDKNKPCIMLADLSNFHLFIANYIESFVYSYQIDDTVVWNCIENTQNECMQNSCIFNKTITFNKIILTTPDTYNNKFYYLDFTKDYYQNLLKNYNKMKIINLLD